MRLPAASRGWIAFGVLLVLIAALYGAYRFGHSVAATECEAGKSKAKTVAIEKHDKAAVAVNAVEKKAAVRADRRDAFFSGLQLEAKTHDKTNPLPGGCGLDAERLRQWNAANAGADVDSAGPADGAARPASAGAEWRAGDAEGKSPGVDARLLDSARPLPGTDRLAGGEGE